MFLLSLRALVCGHRVWVDMRRKGLTYQDSGVTKSLWSYCEVIVTYLLYTRRWWRRHLIHLNMCRCAIIQNNWSVCLLFVAGRHTWLGCLSRRLEFESLPKMSWLSADRKHGNLLPNAPPPPHPMPQRKIWPERSQHALGDIKEALVKSWFVK